MRWLFLADTLEFAFRNSRFSQPRRSHYWSYHVQEDRSRIQRVTRSVAGFVLCDPFGGKPQRGTGNDHGYVGPAVLHGVRKRCRSIANSDHGDRPP